MVSVLYFSESLIDKFLAIIPNALVLIVTLNADWTVVGKGKEKVIAKTSVLQENTDGLESNWRSNSSDLNSALC